MFACFFLRLLKTPETSVFSRVCGLLIKMQRYRILSENGVVNGVVKRSGIGRRRQISYGNGVETHVLAGWRVHGVECFVEKYYANLKNKGLFVFYHTSILILM